MERGKRRCLVLPVVEAILPLVAGMKGVKRELVGIKDAVNLPSTISGTWRKPLESCLGLREKIRGLAEVM